MKIEHRKTAAITNDEEEGVKTEAIAKPKKKK